MKVDAVALIDVLKNEKEAYQELLDLAQTETELIIEGNVEGLLDVVRATEHLMFAVRDLEDRRLALIYKGSDLNFPQQPVNLSLVTKTFDAQIADEVRLLKDKILSIIKDLSETNQTNTGLLKRKISYTDFMLGLLFPDDNPTYGNKPNPQSSYPKLFDGRA